MMLTQKQIKLFIKHMIATLVMVVTPTAQAISYDTRYDYSRYLDEGIISVTDPNNRTAEYHFDLVNNLSKVIYGRGTDSKQGFYYFYDDTYQLKSASSPVGAQKYRYDELDRLEYVNDFGDSNLLRFRYDHQDRITWIIYPEGNGAACYEYDADGRITAVGRLPAGKTATDAMQCSNYQIRRIDYRYDGRGRLSRIDYPNGVYSKWDYYAATGQIQRAGHYRAIDDSTIYSDTFRYLPGTNLYQSISRATAASTSTSHYLYDGYERLKQVREANGRQTDYTYDPFGNRISQTISNSQNPQHMANNPDSYGEYIYTYYPNSNRLHQIHYAVTPGGNSAVLETLSYDNAGRITQRDHAVSGTTQYHFDDRGLLTRADLRVGKGNAQTIEYSYDAFGVRRSKTVDGTTTRYVSANIFGLPHVLMEYEEGILSDSVKATYVYGGGRQLIQEVNGASYQRYPLHDGIVGSITHTLNGAGNLVNEMRYDAFGNQTRVSGPQGHYGYTGEEYDAETGLLYLRARYYDPSLGRFISADPYLGSMAEPVTQNRYIYVHNNPLGFVDPSGLEALCSRLAGACWESDAVGFGEGYRAGAVGFGRGYKYLVDYSGVLHAFNPYAHYEQQRVKELNKVFTRYLGEACEDLSCSLKLSWDYIKENPEKTAGRAAFGATVSSGVGAATGIGWFAAPISPVVSTISLYGDAMYGIEEGGLTSLHEMFPVNNISDYACNKK